MEKFDELLDQLQKHLDCSVQNWFLGAGVSFESNIPLMLDLTKRVETLLDEKESATSKEIYKALKADLPPSCHIEHVLSHIGDLLALAERSASHQCQFAGKSYSMDQLMDLYRSLIRFIGETVRYGYRAANAGTGVEEGIGTLEQPIVEITKHRHFLNALFGSRANLERRSRISFFTTNYDTLLEDALSLERKLTIDGFSGGAMAYWNPDQEFSRSGEMNRSSYKLFKLHGSVDWYKDDDNGLIRSRYGVNYFTDPSQILIYPQASKYIETQKDPFASLFLGLRQALESGEDNIFVTCGYSFGDSHINSEMINALRDSNNKTTLLIFTREEDSGLAQPLSDWLGEERISKKIFIATQKGIYNGSPDLKVAEGDELNWWKFGGLSDFLAKGAVL